MKSPFAGLSVALGLFGSSASAVTLILTDPTGIPIPPGAHVDSYLFPSQLLNPSNPIVSLSVDYDASFAPLGDHEILSGSLLFSSAQIISITPTLVTPTDYEALVQFSVPVTAVSNESAPAFWAVHGEIGGGGLTDLLWTATYLNGSQQSLRDGIIPEPSFSLLAAVSTLSLLSFRRHR